jgi:NHLM bacteriocin system ABC transporter ATP-binding protein
MSSQLESLKNLMEREGTVQKVSGAQPLLLAGNVWFVRSGAVNVFAVQITDGKSAGPRHHVLRAEAGQVLFDVTAASVGGLELIAVGIPDTELIGVPHSRFGELSTGPHIEVIASLIDVWVTELSSAVTPHVSLGLSRYFEDGDELHLSAGENARPDQNVLWIRHLKGLSSFTSFDESRLVAENGFFPVSPHCWLQALEDSDLVALGTKAVLQNRHCWAGLEHFHQVVLRSLHSTISRSAPDDLSRVKKRAWADDLIFEKAYRRLADFFNEEAEHSFAAGDGNEAVLSTCQLVGNAEGIKIISPQGKRVRGLRELIGRIAQASQVRMRIVNLHDGWWKKDCGPLLAFMRQDMRPVALLPRSSGGYVLHDLSAKETTRMTSSVAVKLDRVAYTFYRPFPNLMLKAHGLLKFGLYNCRGEIVTATLLGTLCGILALLPPIVTRIIFDEVIPASERKQLTQIVLALIVCACAVAIFRTIQSIAILRLQTKMDGSIQSAIWDRLLRLPVTFFRRYATGDLVTRALGVSTIRRIFTGAAISAIFNSFFSIFSLGLLFYYDSHLALLACGLTIVTLLVGFLTIYKQLKYQRELYDTQGKISGMVLQLVTGISKLRVAAAEARAFAKWANAFVEQRKLSLKIRTIDNRLIVFNTIFPIFTFIAFFTAIGFFRTSPLSTGTFLGFSTAFGFLLGAISEMNMALIPVSSAIPIFDRLRPIIETLPEVNTTRTSPGDLSGEIEIVHLFFRYHRGAPLVLNDISMHIKAGEFIAFVGPSGSGKSTIFRLLLGFEQPESGTIYYDGRDLAGLDVEAIRRQLGVVLQNHKLIPGSLFTNIAGEFPLTEAEAWEAVRMAGLEEDVKQMPMGLHTIINEGANTFSGGQRQRIAIARAIATKPKVFLFDEATSALDNQTQAIVSENLEKLHTTRIVIAHRLSTIKNADRILVFDQGRVVQIGSFDELYEQPGIFKDLINRQLF